jgi:hypothetical protein
LDRIVCNLVQIGRKAMKYSTKLGIWTDLDGKKYYWPIGGQDW